MNLYYRTYCKYKYPSGMVRESELSEQFTHHEGSGQTKNSLQILIQTQSNIILLQLALACVLSLGAVRGSLLGGSEHAGHHDHEHHHHEVEEETREGRDGFSQ